MSQMVAEEEVNINIVITRSLTCGHHALVTLWQMGQNVLAPQNIDRLGTAGDRDMLKIYIRKVS